MSTNHRFDDIIHRTSPTTSRVDLRADVPITLLMNEELSPEPDALAQIAQIASVQDTLGRLHDAGFFGGAEASLERIVITPDFHRGARIPVGTVLATRGFVLPEAVGHDICCGMRLLATDLDADRLEGHTGELERALRGIFFQGKRDIPMSPRQREALLRDGLLGLHDTSADNAGEGLWAHYDPDTQLEELERAHSAASFASDDVFTFADWVEASGRTDGRDAHIGSVGGGNHFVELQRVDRILDAATAHAWGLEPGKLMIMIHSGSLGFGQAVGAAFRRRAREIFPKELPWPDHGFAIVPTEGPHAALGEAYANAMANAANFAFANRMFMGLMALRAVREVLGAEVGAHLVHDAPHNLVWFGESDGAHVHRKGAHPAYGPAPDAPGAFRYTGHPVLIPGSMGVASFVMAGQGNDDALLSACHGAGRALSRGGARHVDPAVYADAMEPLRVVTPIDPDAHEVRGRRDILEAYHARLMEEGPFAYKPITPVIETIEGAEVARKVAQLGPLLTVKG